MNEMSEKLGEVLAAMEIGLISKRCTPELSFVLLYECELEGESVEGHISHMQDGHVLLAYREFKNKKHELLSLKTALQAQESFVRRPSTTTKKGFDSARECAPVQILLQKDPHYFDRHAQVIFRQVVREMREKGVNSWRHPSSPVGYIFWKVNVALTDNLVSELKVS